MDISIGLAFLIIFGTSFLLMFFRMPIFLCLGGGCMLFMFLTGEVPLAVFGQGLVNGVSNQALIAIALYFLLGGILNHTGLTDRLVEFVKSLIGHIPGALSHINVLASMVFAGVSGSSLADTASVGSLMIPMMKKEGYPAGYAAAITQVSSSIGPIIPPSTGMVFLSIYFNVSVRRLFIGGIVPGILLGVTQLIISYYISKKRNFPCTSFRGWKHVLHTAKGGFFALLLPAGVMVCLLLGIGTVVEIGAASVILAMILAACYKELNIKVVIKALIDVGLQLSAILIMMGASGVFKWIISRLGVANYLLEAMTIFGDSPFAVVTFICVVFLILGCFISSGILQFVIVPILVPAFLAIPNLDLIWLCVLLVLVIQIGQNTPPVGSLIYITSSIADCPASETIKESIPYYIGMMILVAILLVFPPLISWLPSVIMG